MIKLKTLEALQKMRLAVNTGAWIPTVQEWQKAFEVVETCEPDEAARIMRLKIEEDRKRSLVGRVLLRHACSVHQGISYSKVRLGRTSYNKPYCPDLGTGQLNVSHHGDWVVLGSDDIRLIGVDVMRYDEPRKGKEAFFETMKGVFTPEEWAIIGNSIQTFYRMWSLKESYVKALGIGLGFDLQKANFKIDGSIATIHIEGKPEEDWDFFTSELDENHCVSVALGPPKYSSSPIDKEFQKLSVPDLLQRF